MTLLQILILGVVQGITEFLPVSSSGHLVVIQALFAKFDGQVLPDMVAVNVLLHAGTLAAMPRLAIEYSSPRDRHAYVYTAPYRLAVSRILQH